MKVAILYDSKYGNTQKVAKFLANNIGESGHEVKLFRTGKSKAKDLTNFNPEAILVGGPTHIGKPARALGKYLKKLGKQIKKGNLLGIKKAGAFNCYVENIVCDIIKNKIADISSDIEICENSLPVKVEDMKGPLSNNWEENVTAFATEFINFLE